MSLIHVFWYCWDGNIIYEQAPLQHYLSGFFWLPVHTLTKTAASLCVPRVILPLGIRRCLGARRIITQFIIHPYSSPHMKCSPVFFLLHLLECSGISLCTAHDASMHLDESPEHTGSSFQYSTALKQTDSQVPLELALEAISLYCEMCD